MAARAFFPPTRATMFQIKYSKKKTRQRSSPKAVRPYAPPHKKVVCRTTRNKNGPRYVASCLGIDQHMADSFGTGALNQADAIFMYFLCDEQARQ